MNVFSKILGLFQKEKKQVRIEENEFAELFNTYVDIGHRTVRAQQHGEIRFLLLNELCPDRERVRDLYRIISEPMTREKMSQRIGSDPSVAASLRLELDHRRITKGSDSDAAVSARAAEEEMEKIRAKCSHEYPKYRFVFKKEYVAEKSGRKYVVGDEKIECANCGKLVRNTAKERDEKANGVQMTLSLPV